MRLKTSAMLVSAGAIILSVLGYYWLMWGSFDGFVIAIDRCSTPFCDFYRHFFPEAREILRTHEPVVGFFYSPFFALLLTPLGLLDLEPAMGLWGSLQILLVVLLVAAPHYFSIRPNGWLLVSLFLVITSFPVLHNFKWGQVSALIVVSLLACFHLYARGRVVLAGVLLAFCISVKFYPALFLIYFLFRPDLRFIVASAAATLSFLFLIPISVLGLDETIRFYQLLMQSFESAQSWMVYDFNSQNFAKVTSRLAMLAESESMAQATASSIDLWSTLRPIGYSLATANVVLLLLITRVEQFRRSEEAKLEIWGFVLLSLTIPLVVPTTWSHYFVYLPFCQVFLAREIIASADVFPGRAVKLNLFLLLSIVASNIAMFNVSNTREAYSFFGFLFFSNGLLLVLSYLQLIPSIAKAIQDGDFKLHA